MSRVLIFAFFVAAISACAHGYLALWAMRVWPWLAARRRWVWALVAVLTVVTPLARVIQTKWHGTKSQLIFGAGTIELSIVVLSTIPLMLLSIGTDLGISAIRRFRRRNARSPSLPAPAPVSSSSPPAPISSSLADSIPDLPTKPVLPSLTRRQAIEGAGGAAVLAATGSVVGWGVLRERHAFVIEEVPVRIVGLPRALDGYTIAQISDIHVGSWVGERELREGLDRVAEAKADLVVATGDLVDHDEHFVPTMARALASIRARDGVAAILGNHDYYTGAQDVLAGLRAAGVRALVNEGLLIRGRDGGGFALLGVADMFAIGSREQPPSLERAIAMVPPDSPRILLAHQPDYFPIARGKVALQLSGHTHGGQINPGFRPASFFMRYVAGRYQEEGSTLWVNRGFGVAGPPARLNAPPEVTKIILVAA